MIIYLLALLMTLLASVASLFFKRASSSGGIVSMLKNPNLYAGGFLYVAAALLNVYILRFLDYSVVMPLGSITYVWTMVLSLLVLGERITARKIAGVACIVAGAACVALL